MYHYYLNLTGAWSMYAYLEQGGFCIQWIGTFLARRKPAFFFFSFFSFSFLSCVDGKQHQVMEHVSQKQQPWERIHNGYTHIAGIFPKYMGGRVAVRLLWQRQSRTCAFPCVNTVIWKVLYDSQKQLLLRWCSHRVLEIHLNKCIADSRHLFWRFGWETGICLFTSDIQWVYFIRVLDLLFISLGFVDQS